MKKYLKRILIVLLAVLLLGGASGFWLLTPATMIRPDMAQTESAHFVFHYDLQEIGQIDKIARALEQSYQHVTQVLRYRPPAKTAVVIYATQREFQRAARGRILDYIDAEWFVGDNRNGAVLMVSPNIVNAMHDSASIVQVAVHEYVHVIEDSINPALPLYWHEGIALYLANQQIQQPVTSLLADLPPADTLFKTKKNAWNSLTFGNNDGYHLAYLLVEHIVQAYGEGKLPELVRNPTHLEQVFGKSDTVLYADWVEYIKLHYLSAVR